MDPLTVYLELFRSLANRLTDPEEKNTVLSFNDAAYRQTADEVLSTRRRQSLSRQVFRVTTTGWTAIEDGMVMG